MNRNVCIVPLCVLMLIVCCGPVPAGAVVPNEDAQVTVVTKEQNGEQIQVRTCDTIRVGLPTAGGTGYAWYLDEPDSEAVEVVPEGAIPAADDGRTGMPVINVWRLRGKQAGDAEIRLDLYRQWEGRERAIDHFEVKLRIVDGKECGL